MKVQNFTLRLSSSGELIRLRSFLYSFIKHISWRKFKNLLKLEIEMALKRCRLKAYPYIIKLEPANICNLRCPHCFSSSSEYRRPKGEINFPTFKKIIDELGPYCFRLLFYGWGEPLLLKDIYKMIRYASDRNIGVAISSNLNTLSGEQEAEEMVRSGLEYLTISLDGTNQQTYQTYRIGGDFERVISNIKLIVNRKKELRKNTPILEWQYLVTRYNEDEITKAKSMCRDLGVDVIRFSAFALREDAPQGEFAKWLPRNEKYSLYDLATYTEKVSHEYESVCAWLYRVAVINWDGGISPCCFLIATCDTKNDFGNINQEPFCKIWNNELFQVARSLVCNRKITSKVKNEPVCQKCDMVGLKKKNE